MEDDAFLKSIAERPADDAPRLIYADWLGERDDPRAAFLRIEVALAAIASGGEIPAAQSKLAKSYVERLTEQRSKLDPMWWQRLARPKVTSRRVFHCKTCKLPLSSPLWPLVDRSWLCEGDQQPLVPLGFCWLADGAWAGDGHYCLNLADVRNTELHSDFRRRNGCCGMDGCDGVNRVCSKGHEVGTECSDCWMPHYLHLEPSQTVIVEESKSQSDNEG
jgi:uncharacterized protein (TIGR02996 family)